MLETRPAETFLRQSLGRRVRARDQTGARDRVCPETKDRVGTTLDPACRLLVRTHFMLSSLWLAVDGHCNGPLLGRALMDRSEIRYTTKGGNLERGLFRANRWALIG